MWLPPMVHIGTPYLIHLYVIDMSGVANNNFFLYDSAILVADKQKSNIENLLKKELEKVSG